MPAALTLKKNPKVLSYDCICNEAGDILALRSVDELLADCDALKLTNLKYVFEQASSDEAWTALTRTYPPAIIPVAYGRMTLTGKFATVDGLRQLVIAGKSSGISKVLVEVRPA